MKHNHIRLYNLILPVWLILMIPQLWWLVLPANFLVDLTVLWLGLKHLGVENRKGLCRQAVWKVWIFGFLSDFVGAGLMLVWNIWDITGSDFLMAVNFNPFERLDAFLWVTACVAVTGLILYLVNRNYCLKKLPLTPEQRNSLALILSVFTAPWLFYLPTAWFW